MRPIRLRHSECRWDLKRGFESTLCVMQELGALNTTRSIASDVKNLGFTINLHNGDLAYAECALHARNMQRLGPLNVSIRHAHDAQGT